MKLYSYERFVGVYETHCTALWQTGGTSSEGEFVPLSQVEGAVFVATVNGYNVFELELTSQTGPGFACLRFCSPEGKEKIHALVARQMAKHMPPLQMILSGRVSPNAESLITYFETSFHHKTLDSMDLMIKVMKKMDEFRSLLKRRRAR